MGVRIVEIQFAGAEFVQECDEAAFGCRIAAVAQNCCHLVEVMFIDFGLQR